MLFPVTLLILLIRRVQSEENNFCEESLDCVNKIRRMARETNRFWFGDKWTMECGGWHFEQRKRERNAQGNLIACANPPALSPFASLGSRLFRVHTFTNAYLANLRVFPRLHFEPQFGHYRACGHNFEVPPPSKSEGLGHSVHPFARPLPAFQAQKVPHIDWTDLHANESLIVAMVDVGFGKLNYLAVDFPRNTQIVRPYRPIDNFRPGQPTPIVVLIFEASKSEINATTNKIHAKNEQEDENFDLGMFMVENMLERGLIGLNWALINGDAFGIERQRLRGGMPDNCHSLVLHKLLRDRRWHFVDTFALSAELDASLAVSFNQPPLSSLLTCCLFTSALDQRRLYLDPLADFQLPSIVFRHGKPSVTSIWAIGLKSDSLYQRSSRHYFASSEVRFTLVLFDPSRLYLFWLVVDIPTDGLTTGEPLGGTEVAKYVAPIPKQPGHCSFAVFMLFRQPPVSGTDGSTEMGDFFNLDHPIRQRHCHTQCAHRNEFDIEQFKALHRLHLSAISWAKVCFDLFEASHQIALIRKNADISESIDRTSKSNGGVRGGPNKKGSSTAQPLVGVGRDANWKMELQNQIAMICAPFNRTTIDLPDHRTMPSNRRDDFCVPSKSSLPTALPTGIFSILSFLAILGFIIIK